MASVKQQAIYEQVANGKRVVCATVRELPALKIWLFRHGFRWKTNRNGDVVNILISEK